ncbi:MAG: LLM class flavin-dependent oxidoreductase [Dehalococcoidia bacterium]|jgi:alkanesulfonate monooxygenase SsuD/methylene tetrahydromethanopterin reductase-like flavin-dependent oxidoreductase (luciferase family)|nr:LLM class flavin-dependent oxidoreductase [Dehalococcoidia bacterium]MDP6227910.1 LLM class flavin-dependent oxidoreductase [Dehalococcoidia bacterium]MDP7085713.1 LLM class flavin-dependent oxidoreductase [Dehalococcoidia bacterium]MDP7201794.1 LLM class flavin-dependent oxidoreductase [Dehalococcoidia bacterium]MDP7510211.1 LLM class flavin-dependent oxidoreductase [Dehalococcoidia bacterium]
MRFGINMGGGNLRGESREEALTGRLDKARLTHQMGYHSLWTGAGYLNNDFHSMMLLARVAAEAPGLELGMVALLPLYHPVEAAEQVATLDVITGGRFVLAPALGWRDFQFDAFGIPKTDRLGRFREVMEVMKMFWTQDRVTHHGRYFDINDVPGAGGAVQKPYPRMYLAANLERGVLRAARQADGWLISSRSTLPTITQQTGLYRDAVKKEGKPGFISAWREMFVAETRQKAIDIMRPHVEWMYKDRAALGHSQELPEADRIDVPFDRILEGRFILGSPEECIEEIEKYRALGIDELVLRCQWPGMPNKDSLRALELFGDKVLPHYR